MARPESKRPKPYTSPPQAQKFASTSRVNIPPPRFGAPSRSTPIHLPPSSPEVFGLPRVSGTAPRHKLSQAYLEEEYTRTIDTFNNNWHTMGQESIRTLEAMGGETLSRSPSRERYTSAHSPSPPAMNVDESQLDLPSPADNDNSSDPIWGDLFVDHYLAPPPPAQPRRTVSVSSSEESIARNLLERRPGPGSGSQSQSAASSASGPSRMSSESRGGRTQLCASSI